jgi:Ig-like domain from next to BRCA1 gene
VISGCRYRDAIPYHKTDTQYGIRIAYRILYKVGIIFCGLLFLIIGLSACGVQPTPLRPPSSGIHFTPTTQASPTPTLTAQPIETPLATTTPICTNNLTFLETISVPDGTIVHPGDLVDKRWLVQNSGSCNWDERYQLRAITSTGLDAPTTQALYPARSGAKATIRIQLMAPPELGSFQSAWQAYDSQGKPFGDRLNLLIVVNSGTP